MHAALGLKVDRSDRRHAKVAPSSFLPTRESADVHLLEVLSLEDDDGELSRVWHVTQREADVAQLKHCSGGHEIRVDNASFLLK